MDDTITPGMSAALDVIRAQKVTYVYRTMPRSVRRPLPVRSGDLAPAYSHGLNAGTVGALLRRHLVMLSPVDESHGRVLATTKE